MPHLTQRVDLPHAAAEARGIGKPEQLRGDLSGFWSRRINDEHRLVYMVDVDADSVLIAACRFRYTGR